MKLSSTRALITLVPLSVMLTGCLSSSGSSSSSVKAINTPDTAPVVVVPETPVPVDFTDITCDSVSRLAIKGVKGDDLTHVAAPDLIIDGSLLDENYWSAEGVNRAVVIELADPALVKGVQLAFVNEDDRTAYFDVSLSKDLDTWNDVVVAAQYDETALQHYPLAEDTARYIRIVGQGNSFDSSNKIREVQLFGCTKNSETTIELEDWYLSIPIDENGNGRATSISENDLAAGFFDTRYFFVNEDEGLVFRNPVEGFKTSTNTSYTRTELREMLRKGNTSIKTQGVNKNNWVFSSTTLDAQDEAGGVDGVLTAELTVNHVTSTGEDYQKGRVIIGQIHANDDEPVRLYYRKLPNNARGSIYIAHEILGGDDLYFELIGSRDNNAPNPVDGIALNERFGYRIEVEGHQLTVTITREGLADVSEVVDMSDSGYDDPSQYMYFKAGVYNQNNSGHPNDFVEATFYKIDNSHK